MKTMVTRLNDKVTISTMLIDGVWETGIFKDDVLDVDMRYTRTEKQAVDCHIRAIREKLSA